MWKPIHNPRSVMWVVTTHVATSFVWTVGLMLLAMCVIGSAFVQLGSYPSHAVLGMGVAFCAALAATEHSLHYIRTRTIPSNPRACVTPSILIYAGILGGLLVLSALVPPREPTFIQILVLLGFLISPTAAFAILTWWRFSSMDAPDARGFDVRPPMRVEPIDPPESDVHGDDR